MANAAFGSRAIVLALSAVALLMSPRHSGAQVAVSLADLAAKVGMKEDALEAAGAAPLLSTDLYVRRTFLKKLGEEPLARRALLPVIVLLADKEPDWPMQLTARKLISCFALRADREEVRARVLPLLERGVTEGKSQLLRVSLEELRRLSRWFRFDEQLAPLFARQLKGEDFNLRSLAFRAVTDFHHPRIVRELVLPTCWEVYQSKHTSLFDRRQAVRVFVREGVVEAVPKLAWNLRHDGRVALVSAYGLGKLLDPKTLPELRKIDKRAVHSLRMLSWRARCRMNDPRCLKEVLRVLGDKNEHTEIKRTFVADLGEMGASVDKVRTLATKLLKHRVEAVRVGAAVALLRLDDPRGASQAKATLLAPWADDQHLGRKGKGWMRQLRFMDDILQIRSAVVAPVLLAMLDVGPRDEDVYDKDGKPIYERWFRFGLRRSEKLTDWYAEYRADAVSRLGELRAKEALPRLTEISKGEWGHIRFHALVSRIELGDAKALWALRWYLPRYDDGSYRDVKAIMGKVTVYSKRLKWTSLFDLCAKIERRGPKDKALYLPLLDEILQPEQKGDDPMAAGWAKRGGAGEGGEAGSGATVRRGDHEGSQAPGADPTDPLASPPEVSYRLRNQFARRRVVECAARIGGEDAAKILGRALRDCRASVRAAALTEIGHLGAGYDLPLGSLAEKERAARPKAIRWLDEHGAWPK